MMTKFSKCNASISLSGSKQLATRREIDIIHTLTLIISLALLLTLNLNIRSTTTLQASPRCGAAGAGLRRRRRWRSWQRPSLRLRSRRSASAMLLHLVSSLLRSWYFSLRLGGKHPCHHAAFCRAAKEGAGRLPLAWCL